MTLHHTKHHQAYVTNLNAALNAQAQSISSSNLVDQIHVQAAIRFNAGGHINHTLFWQNLTPAGRVESKLARHDKIAGSINLRWGSFDNFKAKFEAVLLGIQGSGWGWLVQDVESGVLELVTTKDQDIVPRGKKPLLGIDMWEHAYYLQYLNNKKDYVTGIWNVINWKVVNTRHECAIEEVYGSLTGLAKSM